MVLLSPPWSPNFASTFNSHIQLGRSILKNSKCHVLYPQTLHQQGSNTVKRWLNPVFHNLSRHWREHDPEGVCQHSARSIYCVCISGSCNTSLTRMAPVFLQRLTILPPVNPSAFPPLRDLAEIYGRGCQDPFSNGNRLDAECCGLHNT